MNAKDIFYFTLPAPDVEKSTVFYSAVLGWQTTVGSLGGHVENTTTPCGLSRGSSSEETTIYLATFDLDGSVEQVKQGGGVVDRQEEFSSGRCAYCRDNQGTYFCLQQPSKELLEHAQSVKKGCKEGDLFFFSLPVQDESKARKFYGSVAGWEFGEKGKEGGLGVKNIKGPRGGLGCGRDGHRPSFWFRVTDIETAIERVKTAGGKANEVFDAPEGRMCECYDDQNVKIGLVKPAPGF